MLGKIRRSLRARYAAMMLKKALYGDEDGARGQCCSPAVTAERADASRRPDYIDDQTSSGIASFRLGALRADRNACEVIALYNALAREGKDPDLGGLMRHFSRLRHGAVLFGLFGVAPWALERYLVRSGVPARLYPYEAFRGGGTDALLSRLGCGCAILTFWWSESSWHIHTVMAERLNDCFVVHNFDPWRGRDTVRVSSLDALAGEYGMDMISLIAVGLYAPAN